MILSHIYSSVLDFNWESGENARRVGRENRTIARPGQGRFFRVFQGRGTPLTPGPSPHRGEGREMPTLLGVVRMPLSIAARIRSERRKTRELIRVIL